MYTIRTSTDPSFWMNVHTYLDDTMSPLLVENGCFECPLHFALMSTLRQFPSDSTIFFDVGSNLGFYTLGAAAQGYRVYSFEPLLRNWAPMCYSLLANPGFHSKVHLLAVALSTGPKHQVGFHTPWYSNPSATRVIPYSGMNATTLKHENQSKEGVQWAWAISMDYFIATTLSFLPRNKTVVLKIDTEGHECQVLEGGMAYLQSLYRIPYVAMECSTMRWRQCSIRDEIFSLFQRHSLSPYIYSSISPYEGIWTRSDYSNWTEWVHLSGMKGPYQAYNIHFSSYPPQVPASTKLDNKTFNPAKFQKRSRNLEPLALEQIE
jgi:FkbM family methyltransferase